ncbi:MAG TPA: disulfide oxidoreductase [Candidatus Peribacteraceae bacterium]|nr:disulfide oxidoreductase [Candidatus Peribacteraceae bacterium]
MSAFTPHIVKLLAILTVVGQCISVILIVALLKDLLSPKAPSRLLRWVSRQSLVLMLIVALTATLGSLYFSEVAYWTPCRLCWFQRIFMYPQVLLLAVAIWHRDRGVARYLAILSAVGLLIAAFHYGEQVTAAIAPPTDLLVPCDETGVSCASTPFFHFGYITIPMMAFTAFLLNALGSLIVLRTKA